MTVTEIICGGVLLSAIGVLGFAATRSKTEETPDSSTDDKPEGREPDSYIEAIRTEHRVGPISQQDEGTSVFHLPAGVFGFTYSPRDEMPLFREKRFQQFEVHKLSDGSVHLIGFVTENEAAALSASADNVKVALFPDPWKESSKAVSIPLARVAESHGPSRYDGNSIRLVLSRTSRAD